MIIDSATYTNQSKQMIKVVVNGRALFVPVDEANSDYQRIKAQVDAGALVIAPYVAPVP